MKEKQRMDINGNYVQNQFCSYEIALELKELGFDEHCLGIYISKELNPYLMYASQHDVDMATGNDGILAPLYQQIFDWFREKYGLHIDIGLEDKEEGYYNYAINLNWRYEGGTYYEARKLAILDAIRVVQNKEDKSWRFPYETN